MLSIIDPAADALWESVATLFTHEGTEQLRPRTDEDWEALRHEAVRLVEATNLLLMDGREVARQGFRSEYPGIELEPDEIQALIDEDPDTWDRLVGDLYQVSVTMLTAVENRDADRLFEEGAPLDMACEACHQRYWYPDEAALYGTPAATPFATVARAALDPHRTSAAAGPTGTIEGHARLDGDLPGNRVIRMGVDPHCARLTEGRQMLQECRR